MIGRARVNGGPEPSSQAERCVKKIVAAEQPQWSLAQGNFEPVLAPKQQRRLSGLDDKILTLYTRGMSTRDSSWQLAELYGTQLSPALISEVLIRSVRRSKLGSTAL